MAIEVITPAEVKDFYLKKICNRINAGLKEDGHSYRIPISLLGIHTEEIISMYSRAGWNVKKECGGSSNKFALLRFEY